MMASTRRTCATPRVLYERRSCGGFAGAQPAPAGPYVAGVSALAAKAAAFIAALGLLGACGGSPQATVAQTAPVATTGVSTTSVAPTTTTSTTETATSVDHSPLTSSVPETGDTDSGWVSPSARTVIYLSWVDSKGQLAGTLERASLDSTGSTVVPKSIPFTGIRAESKVSINLEDGRRWQGTIDSAGLSLRIPQPDGTIAQLVLSRGGVDDFNKAVTALQSSAGSTRSSVAEAQAQVSASQQFTKAQNDLDAAVANLRSALNEIPDVLSTYETAAHHGLAAAVADVDKALGTAPLDCGDVSFKVGGVDFARGGVSYVNSSLTGRLQTIATAYDRLTRAQAALYAISEPDSSTEDFSIAEEEVKAVSAATATAAKYDADADASVAGAKARASRACPDVT